MRLFSLPFTSLPLDTILNILYCAYYCMQFVRTAQFKHKHPTSSHSQPRTPSLASWPLRIQFVRTARSKHKTPPRTLGRTSSHSQRRTEGYVVATWYVVLIVCSIISTAQFKHKHLLALSTEDGGAPGPRVRSLYTLHLNADFIVVLLVHVDCTEF